MEESKVPYTSWSICPYYKLGLSIDQKTPVIRITCNNKSHVATFITKVRLQNSLDILKIVQISEFVWISDTYKYTLIQQSLIFT